MMKKIPHNHAAPVEGWHTVTNHFLLRLRLGKQLSLNLIQDGAAWIVLGVETEVRNFGVPKLDVLKQIFAEHSHATAGRFATFAKARNGAERFAAQWLKGRPLEKCSCIRKRAA